MNEKQMNRVRKLLALARSSYPPEAAAAIDKAKQILAPFGISPEEFSTGHDIGEELLFENPRIIPYWESVLLSGLLTHYALEALFLSVGKKERVTLIGHDNNIARMRNLYDYLYTEIQSLSEDYAPVVRDLNSFRLGMAEILCEKLERLEDIQSAANQSMTDKDLIPVSEDQTAKQVDDFLEQNYGVLKERERVESFDSDSRGLGRAVGRKICLLTQLDEE